MTKRRGWVVAGLLGLATLAVFLPAVQNGFVEYDDADYILENRRLREGFTLENLRWAFTSSDASNWHPVTWLSHLLDYRLFGATPWGHHLVGALLHAVNAALCLLVLRGLTGLTWPSAAAAALFAVHPLHVESVAWAAERKDVLSGLFFMLTLLAWTKYVRGVYHPLLPLEGGGGVGVWAKDPGFVIHPPPTPPLEGGEQNKRGHDPTGIPGHDLNSGTSELRIVSPRANPLLPLEGGGGVGVWPKDFGFVIHPPPTPPLKGGEQETRGHDPNSGSSEMGIVSPRTVSSAHTRIFTLNRWYFLTLVLFALGLMAKPMLVTLPFVLLLLDWWPLGRLSVGRRWSSGTPGRPSAWIVLLEKLPFLALTAGSMALTWWAQYGSGAVETWEDSGLGFRLGNAVVAYAVYLRKMLLPWDLAVFYPRPLEVFPAWQVVISLAALSVLTVAAFRQARRRPWLLAGWCWYLGMLLPVIGLVQVGSQAWADRYTYLPVLGIFWALALLGREVSRRGRSPRALVAGIGVAALAACVVLTFLQIGLWRDTESLFNRAIRVTEKNWVAHTSLGAYLSRQKRLDEAIPHYREALRWAPYYRKARFNLGLALAQQGKLPEAVEQLSVAVELDPDYTKAQHNLALALQRLGRDAEAVIHFQEAIRLMPDNADMRHQLAVSLARLGRMEEARQQEAAAMDLIRRGM